MRLACADLFSWSENGARIVTPSRFLAAVASEQIAREQLDRGLASWQRTRVYSIDAWLSVLWNEVRYKSIDVPTLLSAAQEHALWREIIESRHTNLFDPASTAHLAVRAAKLIAEWHIPTEGDAWNDHEDARQFQLWYKLFRQRCRERAWITRSDIWGLLPKWIAGGMCSLDLTVFTAFETFTPALERVKQELGLFAAVEEINVKNETSTATVQPCSDFYQELELAARWARARFEQSPALSIGIFIPDLIHQRTLVERMLDRVFYPSATLQFADSRRAQDDLSQSAGTIFHINRGAPLCEHPLIASALLLLELGRPRIAIADAGAILRCAFIKGAISEASARALADVELRKNRDLDVRLRDLEFAARDCPLLTQLWSGVRSVLSRKSRQLEFANWSELFTDLLKALGWPGDRPCTTEEQETVDAWKETLSTLASLGLVSGAVPYHVALVNLRRLLSRPGLERGDWSSPIQIVDWSDAAALEFDCASVTGLSDETWPAAIETHPLIPLKLQRARGIPGSSAEAARFERQRMTEWLFRAAPVEIATYSGRLAPVAEQFATSSEEELLLWSGKLPRDSYAPEPLIELEDWTAPPYHSIDPVKGGTAVIRAQSQCPFRAFAEYRLNAQRPEDACFGFDPRDRGKFLHKALEYVWSRLETQGRLSAIPDDELRAIVQDAVAQAVKDNRLSPFHELITATERERLEELILEWLVEIERKRTQPFRVENIEQERLVTISGLPLNLRVDRIDRLKNGNVLLIDYKSGAQSRKKLEWPRPPEPQLWVYAAATEDRVDGVFFAEMKQRNARPVGFSREKHFNSTSVTIKGSTWTSFLTECTEEIRRIAGDFVTGNAAVDPIRNACQYCNVKPFCRVNEGVRQEQDEE